MENFCYPNHKKLLTTLVFRYCWACACVFVFVENKQVILIFSFNLIPYFCFGQSLQQQQTESHGTLVAILQNCIKKVIKRNYSDFNTMKIKKLEDFVFTPIDYVKKYLLSFDNLPFDNFNIVRKILHFIKYGVASLVLHSYVFLINFIVIVSYLLKHSLFIIFLAFLFFQIEKLSYKLTFSISALIFLYYSIKVVN